MMKGLSKEFQSSAWGTPPLLGGSKQQGKSGKGTKREKPHDKAKNEDSIRESQAGASQISIKCPRRQSQ